MLTCACLLDGYGFLLLIGQVRLAFPGPKHAPNAQRIWSGTIPSAASPIQAKTTTSQTINIMKGKILILLCLLASLGGSSTVFADSKYSSKQITLLKDIKFDGTTKYAFQVVAADYEYDYLNRFLRYGIVTSNSIQVVGLGLTSGSGYTSISTICDNMTQEEGMRYAFTLSGSASSCVAKNYDNTVWGNAGGNYKNRPGGVAEENAVPLTLVAGNTANTFRISMGGNTLRVIGKQSPYVSYGYSSYEPRYVDFAIYEIIEPAASTSVHYYFYNSTGTTKLKEAEFTEYEGSSISGLADLPNYVTATYYTDATMSTPVEDTSVAPTPGAKYYVKTDYISGMPFDLSGNYFCLGSYGDESFQTSTIPTGKPSVAKYAIKMTGNWADKFTLQDINGYYLGNTAENKTFSSSNTSASKFDIEYREFYGSQFFVLKSMANDKYIYLSSGGGISYVDNKNYATNLNNLTTDQVSDFLEYCPAERYVGAYSKTQKDDGSNLSLNDILNGNKKIAYNSDRYYYLEAVDNPGFVLSAQASSKNLKDGSINYEVGVVNNDGFAGLWSLKNSLLKHVNTQKDMNVNGELGNGFGYLAHSSVKGMSVPYQAFTIKLGYSGTTTYLSRAADNSLVMADTEPTTEAGYWYLREASSYTIPLNDVGGEAYATLCAPVNLKFNANDDVTIAYTGELATETIDGKEVKVLNLTEVDRESVIAAGTPLVLYNPSTNVVSKFDVVYNASVSYTPNDTWKGTLINLVFGGDEATAKKYRTLGNGGIDKAGFYVPKTTTKIPANRAYIEMPSTLETQAMLPIRFEDGTLTWIDASILMGEQTDNGATYDLSGRRIMQPQRGQLYIRGGKKFIAQ